MEKSFEKIMQEYLSFKNKYDRLEYSLNQISKYTQKDEYMSVRNQLDKLVEILGMYESLIYYAN